jgi:hypothetical protein
VAFGFAPPAASRLEVAGPLGGTVAVFVTGGGRMMAYDALAKAAAVGADDRKNFAAVFGADLGGSLSEIVARLAGFPPLWRDAVAAGEMDLAAEETAGGDIVLCWRRGEELVQQLTLAGEPPRLKGTRYFEGGVAVADVVFDDWRAVESEPTPFALTLKTADATAEVTIRKLERGVTFGEDAFDPTPPAAAVEVISLDAAADADERR